MLLASLYQSHSYAVRIPMSSNPRVADYPIHPQFTDRWSPRAFTGESIPVDTLLSFFEAARWSPSAYNSQPWRFLYARRDTPNWERFLGLLNEFNRDRKST